MNIDELIKALAKDNDFKNPVIHKLREEIIRYEYLLFIIEECLGLAKKELETLNARAKEIEIMESEVYSTSKYCNEYMDIIIKADNLCVLIEKLEEAKVKGYL